jgi:hypothetical protein
LYICVEGNLAFSRSTLILVLNSDIHEGRREYRIDYSLGWRRSLAGEEEEK